MNIYPINEKNVKKSPNHSNLYCEVDKLNAFRLNPNDLFQF